ncbi:hypothetical protein Tco_0115969 [Tanacetum coccineum]
MMSSEGTAKQDAAKQGKCLKIVTFEGTIDSEIMERKFVIARLNKVSSPDGDYLVIYRANGNFRAFNYLLEIMMEFSTEENDQSDFWNNQQNWEIVIWRLYEACRFYILELEDGTVIHMLVERRYPLSKDLLQRMLDFGLEVEVESTAALDLIRITLKDVTSSSVGSHMAHSRSPGSRVLTFGVSLFLVRCGYDSDFSLIWNHCLEVECFLYTNTFYDHLLEMSVDSECGLVACLRQPFVLFSSNVVAL